MTKLLEKVAHFLVGEQTPATNLHEIRIEFIEDKTEIIHHIEACKRSRGIVGIYSPALGRGMFLSTVTDVYKLGVDTLIDLKPYHFKTGLQRKVTISIKDVNCICPFNQTMS